MTNDATSEHPGTLESPAPPLGEAAAFVAKLFSGCDQQPAVGEDTPSSMDRPKLATADNSIPTACPPAALPNDHDEPVERATPLPSSARGLPQYSNTTISLIIVVLAVLTFGSGLAVGYGILGRRSKPGSTSAVKAAKSLVDRDPAPSKRVDDQQNAAAVLRPNPTVASVEPSATQLNLGHAGVLSDSGSDNDLQRPAAKALSGQSESTQAIIDPPRVPVDSPISSKNLASVNPGPGHDAVLAVQPPSITSLHPTASDGTMHSVETPTEAANPGGAPIASVHPKNVLPAAKAADIAGTAGPPGLVPNATEARGLPDSAPEGQRQPIAASAGQIDPCQLIHSVQPVYPREAKKLHVEGDVELRVVVGTDGTVHSVGLVRGLPMLVPAAMDAAREFRYKPASLNGQPIETVQTVDMSFKLKN